MFFLSTWWIQTHTNGAYLQTDLVPREAEGRWTYPTSPGTNVSTLSEPRGEMDEEKGNCTFWRQNEKKITGFQPDRFPKKVE